MNEMKYQCWMNDVEKILSFRMVQDFELHEFDSHEALLQFVFDAVDKQHCRVQ